MKIRFLGTGTSTGVPQIGCECDVCTSNDPRDKRLRCSALVDFESGERILIDCGPDFRQQMIPVDFRALNGVLLTHIHYDHAGGIDDLRPFCEFGDIRIFADSTTTDLLRQQLPYCFAEHLYPGVPRLVMNEVQAGTSFEVGNVDIVPFTVMHGKMPILAYRMGGLAYITDMSSFPDESACFLQNVDVLVVNALRHEHHNSHQTLQEALAFIEKVKPREAYLVHMSHDMGLHRDIERQLPPHVRFAYDGLEVYCKE